TRADLVRAFERSDDEIEREIRDDLLLMLWMSPDDVDVTVDAGDVSLRGRVDTRADADVLVRCTRGVPGVLDVRSWPTWAVGSRAPRPRRAARLRCCAHVRATGSCRRRT